MTDVVNYNNPIAFAVGDTADPPQITELGWNLTGIASSSITFHLYDANDNPVAPFDGDHTNNQIVQVNPAIIRYNWPSALNVAGEYTCYWTVQFSNGALSSDRLRLTARSAAGT